MESWTSSLRAPALYHIACMLHSVPVLQALIPSLLLRWPARAKSHAWKRPLRSLLGLAGIHHEFLQAEVRSGPCVGWSCHYGLDCLAEMVDHPPHLGCRLYSTEKDVKKSLESSTRKKDNLKKHDIRGVLSLAQARGKTITDVDFVMRSNAVDFGVPLFTEPKVYH